MKTIPLPRVLISIINWNNATDTIRAVNSLKNLSYSHYDVVVIDNASKDNSLELLRKSLDKIEIIANKKNLGFAGGHKVAVEYALNNQYDAIWILNNDIEVFENSLMALVNAYQKFPTSLYGSITLEQDGFTIGYAGGAEMLDLYTVDRKSGYNIFGKQKYNDVKDNLLQKQTSDLNGSSIFIPISIIKEYGFMDVKWFLYGEETDYCLTLSSKFGVPSILVPDSIIMHKGSASLKLNKRLSLVKLYYFTRNINLLYKKHYNDKIIVTGGILHLIKFFTKHYLFNKRNKDIKYWSAYYTKLGLLHSILRLRGKYVNPDKFF